MIEGDLVVLAQEIENIVSRVRLPNAVEFVWELGISANAHGIPQSVTKKVVKRTVTKDGRGRVKSAIR